MMGELKALSHQFRPGGVMRCCVASLQERVATHEAPSEGEALPCKYCSSGLVYHDGAWEWNRE